MSKFIDRLNQVSQAVAQPMGFRAGAGTQAKPKLLLVAGVTELNGVADHIAEADAGLVNLAGLGLGAFKKVVRAAPDIPWGVANGGDKEISQILDAGCDFVVFPADSTALAMFQGEGVGKILAVEPSLSDSLVRAADRLPVDAVLVGYEQEEVLTWHHLMQIQRYADLLAKPLLVSIPANTVAAELQAMLAAGVSGVVVEVDAGQPPGRMGELRKMIDSLAPPPRRKWGRLGAIVPLVGGRTAEAAEEPEEEEEEE